MNRKQQKLGRAIVGLERAEARLAAAFRKWEKARKRARYYEKLLDRELLELVDDDGEEADL